MHTTMHSEARCVRAQVPRRRRKKGGRRAPHQPAAQGPVVSGRERHPPPCWCAERQAGAQPPDSRQEHGHRARARPKQEEARSQGRGAERSKQAEERRREHTKKKEFITTQMIISRGRRPVRQLLFFVVQAKIMIIKMREEKEISYRQAARKQAPRAADKNNDTRRSTNKSHDGERARAGRCLAGSQELWWAGRGGVRLAGGGAVTWLRGGDCCFFPAERYDLVGAAYTDPASS